MSDLNLSTSGATTFPRFNDLPYELRHLIYSHMNPHRILRFRTNNDVETYLDQRRPLDNHLWLASPCPPPTVLSMHEESRTYGLARYKSLSAPYQNLMVDPLTDLWWLEHRNRTSPDYTASTGPDIPGEEFGLSEKDKKRVGNVLICIQGSPSFSPKLKRKWLRGLWQEGSFWVDALETEREISISDPAAAGVGGGTPGVGTTGVGEGEKGKEEGLKTLHITCLGEPGETWDCLNGVFIMENGLKLDMGITLQSWEEDLKSSKRHWEEKIREMKAQGGFGHVRGTEGVKVVAVDVRVLEFPRVKERAGEWRMGRRGRE